MNKRQRHAAVCRAIDAEARRSRHNATLSFFGLSFHNDEEERAAWDELQFIMEVTVRDINSGACAGTGYIEDRIRAYGRVGCYGRSGATCLPAGWVSTGGGSSYRVKDSEDFLADGGASYGKLFRLLVDMREWNAYVRALCSTESIKDILGPWLEERAEERMTEARLDAEARKRYAARCVA